MVLIRPQRLTPPAAPGALLKRALDLHTRLKIKRLVLATGDDAYLAQVRECPCLKCGMDPAGQAAHVRMQSGAYNKRGAMGRKPDDRWTVPLCNSCHLSDPDALHRIGEIAFWSALGLNPLLICQKLYAAKDDIVRMRAVVFAAISERAT